MANFIKARIRQPRDSEANWIEKNPILLKGERIFVDFVNEEQELIETKEKIGDGVTSFNDLPYFSISNSSGLISSENMNENTIIEKNQMVLVPNTVTVERVEEDGATPIQREQTFYSAKVGNDLPLSETTYLANLKAGEGWGSVVQVEATTEGDMNPNGTKYITPSATGQRAVALGKYTIADGDASMAVNYDAKATGLKSFAANSNTLAEGVASTAFGHVTESKGQQSFVFGTYNQVLGNNALAGGAGSVAEGASSIAVGVSTLSSSDNTTNKRNAYAAGVSSIAIGQENKALGDYSVALGHYSLAKGDYSFSGGNSETAIPENVDQAKAGALGLSSFAFGLNALAKGDYSLAFGRNTTATTNYSLAFGDSAQANASDGWSIAMGVSAKAPGERSIAIGQGAQANGTRSIALGYNNQANGQYSFSAGNTNNAKFNYSVTFGAQNTANAAYQFITGYYSKPNNTDYFVIGNGIDNNNRHNLFSIGKDNTTQQAYIQLNNKTTLTSTKLQELIDSYSNDAIDEQIKNLDAKISSRFQFGSVSSVPSLEEGQIYFGYEVSEYGI